MVELSKSFRFPASNLLTILVRRAVWENSLQHWILFTFWRDREGRLGSMKNLSSVRHLITFTPICNLNFYFPRRSCCNFYPKTYSIVQSAFVSLAIFDSFLGLFIITFFRFTVYSKQDRDTKKSPEFYPFWIRLALTQSPAWIKINLDLF